MKTQKELADLEAKLDFAALSGSLLARLRRGELGQRKSVSSLLDRIGDTLLELRRHRVPLRQIAAELKQHGLQVSEGRLRAYFLSRRERASGRKKASSAPKAPAPNRPSAGGPLSDVNAATSTKP